MFDPLALIWGRVDPLLTRPRVRDLDPVDTLDPLGFKLDIYIDTLGRKKIKRIKGIKGIKASPHAHTHTRRLCFKEN